MGLFGNRVVSVTVKADTTSFIAGMRAAAASTEDFGKKAASHAGKNSADWNKVGMAAMGAGALIGAGVVTAVKAFADFDKQMSSVKAATHETAGNMDALRAAALQAGKDTAFSATEAAQGIEALAKAGVSTKDILGGGLKGALDLAAAGSMDVQAAAEIAASTLTQFSLKGADVGHVADLLAAGAGKAQGEVSDLGYALRQSGTIAAQMGLSVEDTVGALSEFASAGITGSDAGTSFKQMLLSLTPTTDVAKAAMDQYGLSFVDANGNILDYTRIAGELQDKLGGLGQAQQIAALKTIFGSDAYRVAAIAMKGGSAAAREWINKVNDTGYAAETARLKTDNLAGDFERLKGSLETAFIGGGSGANAGLRSLVQGLDSVIDTFNKLPAGAQEATVQVAALGAGALLVGGAVLAAVPKVVAFKEALDTLGLTAGRTGSAMSVLGKAGLIVGLAAVSVEVRQATAAMDIAQVKTEDLSSALVTLAGSGQLGAAGIEVFKNGWGPFREETLTTQQALDRFGEAAAGVFSDDALNRIGKFMEPERMDRFKDRVGQIDTALSAMVTSGNADNAAAALERFINAVPPEFRDQVRAMFTGYDASVAALVPTMDEAGNVVMKTTKEIESQADAAKKAEQALKDFKNAIDAAFGYLDIQEAQDRFTQGLNDMATAAAKAHGKLTGNSQAVRDLRESMRGQVDIATGWLKTMADQGASQEDVAKKAIELKNRIMEAGVAAGVSRPKLAEFLKGFENIPGVKEMELKLKTDPALHKKREFEAELKKIPKSVLTQLKADPSGATLKTKEARAEYKKIPKWVLTQLQLNKDGASHTRAEYQTELKKIPRSILTQLRADPSGATLKTKEAKAEYNKIPKWVLTKLDAEKKAAEAKIFGWKGLLHSVPNSITTTPKAATGPATNSLFKYKGTIAGVPRSLTTTPKAATGGATSSLFKYKGTIGSVPTSVTTTAKVVTGAAQSAWQRFINAVSGRTVTVGVLARPLNSPSSLFSTHAEGGYISGPGGPRDDVIPAMLSNGEFVVNAAATKKNLGLLHALNAQKFASGGLVGFADGGTVDVSEYVSRYQSSLGDSVSRGDITAAIKKRTDAIHAQRIAEQRLHEVRKRHHTASQLASAEENLRKKRVASAAATANLHALEGRRAAQTKPAIIRFNAAVAQGVKNTNAFVNNINKLRSRGFGRLADQFLAQGDAEAETLAAQAARASSTTLRQMTTTLRNASAAQARLDVAKNGTALSQYTGAKASSIKNKTAFIKNVQTIAARGYGKLAQDLIDQGDEQAEAVAAQAAAASSKTLGSMTTQIDQEKKASAQLEHLGSTSQILAALTKKPKGLRDLSALTSLGLSDLIDALQYVDLSKNPAAKGILADLAKFKSTGTFATGGLITGSGTDTSDSILARVSTGEFVMSAAAVRKYGKGFMDGINSRQWATGDMAAASSAVAQRVVYEDHLHIAADGVAVNASAQRLARFAVSERARRDSLRARRRP
jgi:TP901 family phage tail tape measure protein